MYCYKCGHELANDMMFCPKCGTKVINESLEEKELVESTEEKISVEEFIARYDSDEEEYEEEFNILGNSWKIYEDEAAFRWAIMMVKRTIDTALKVYKRSYGDLTSFDMLVLNLEKLTTGYVQFVFDIFCEEIEKQGISVSREKIFEIYEDFYANDFRTISNYNFIKQVSETLDNQVEDIDDLLSLEKSLRPRVAGGGSGFKGAVSGIFAASIVNAGVGLAYDVKKSFQKEKFKRQIDKVKKQVFENQELYENLWMGLKHDIQCLGDCCCLYIQDVTNYQYSHCCYEEIILEKLEQIQKTIYDSEAERQRQYFYALIKNPLLINTYDIILRKYGDKDGEIHRFADFYKVNLETIIEKIVEEKIRLKEYYSYSEAKNLYGQIDDYLRSIGESAENDLSIVRSIKNIIDFCEKFDIVSKCVFPTDSLCADTYYSILNKFGDKDGIIHQFADFYNMDLNPVIEKLVKQKIEFKTDYTYGEAVEKYEQVTRYLKSIGDNEERDFEVISQIKNVIEYHESRNKVFDGKIYSSKEDAGSAKENEINHHLIEFLPEGCKKKDCIPFENSKVIEISCSNIKGVKFPFRVLNYDEQYYIAEYDIRGEIIRSLMRKGLLDAKDTLINIGSFQINVWNSNLFYSMWYGIEGKETFTKEIRFTREETIRHINTFQNVKIVNPNVRINSETNSRINHVIVEECKSKLFTNWEEKDAVYTWIQGDIYYASFCFGTIRRMTAEERYSAIRMAETVGITRVNLTNINNKSNADTLMVLERMKFSEYWEKLDSDFPVTEMRLVEQYLRHYYEANISKLKILMSSGNGYVNYVAEYLYWDICNQQKYTKEATRKMINLADKGVFSAITLLGELCISGGKEYQISKDIKRGKFYLELAVESGFPPAMVALGKLYKKGGYSDGTGNVIECDSDKGKELFLRAAKLGSKEGQKCYDEL